ncbi:hypothetical protein E2562_014314 [Oryza meyeriana var. granulata]|uniref:Leucine-rich repeat-containing N-terminal plant-type domain-containing protein n=1 Tax=Oryza meyeriana var. granulata TaxID=110450 RepID=A0A6G1C4W3_9ORYZ|nr:hypothetical protein E2562_014314 [Oryza meyeriana var. granulata]
MSTNATAAADELALLSVKSMLSSPSSSLLASWNTSIHYCSWPGVVCSRRHPDRVAALRMASFNLSGLISPFLANLSFLRELDLAENQLAGEIPPELGRLGRLESLNLAANALQGTLPVALGNCTNLMVIYLSSNQLQAHVGDFGLAKILAEGSSSLQHSTSSLGFRGTIGYAAPVRLS